MGRRKLDKCSTEGCFRDIQVIESETLQMENLCGACYSYFLSHTRQPVQEFVEYLERTEITYARATILEEDISDEVLSDRRDRFLNGRRARR